MVVDNQIVPILAPAKFNPRSDEEYAATKPKVSRQERSSNKCLVYVLAAIVILSSLFLVFALVVMRPKDPQAQLSFIRVNNLKYASGNGTNNTFNNNTSLPSFNMTLETELKIQNSNFGEFRYANTTARVFYGAVSVGEVVLGEDVVGARDTRMINVKVVVASNKYLNSTSLAIDINSGILKMSSSADFNGRVHLLKIAKKSRTAAMVCSFNLNLISGSVEDLVCN